MKITDNVKIWYQKEYPTDDLGEGINKYISFFDIISELENVYNLIRVHDSLVKERCFSEIAKILNIEYDIIYDRWLLLNEN